MKRISLYQPVAWALVLSLLLLAAPTSAADEKALKLEIPKTRVKALDFMGVTAEGKPIRLSDYKGHVVLLNFWATWCVPCLEEMPAMERLAEKMQGKRFKILAVDLQESQDKVRQFAKAANFTFPLVLDPAGEISLHYGVQTIPVSYIIDGTGTVFRRAKGGRAWDSADAVAFFSDLIKVSALDTAQPASRSGGRPDKTAPPAAKR